jgi:hypothetical protein
MQCDECEELWETYIGLKMRHRHCVVLARDGNCTAVQCYVANAEMEAARQRLERHRLGHDAKALAGTDVNAALAVERRI